MHHSTSPLAGLCAATALLALAGCGKSEAPVADAPDEVPLTAADATAVSDEAATPIAAAALPEDTLGDEDTLDALIAKDDIPYPVYPNGTRYRVGGENGLRIVLFETEDSFDEVDAYYLERSGEAGMPRLEAMSDYVRYAKNGYDADPWATGRPGIVIHRFDEGEREAVGADEGARTNIIMSF